ncbi:olfactory receptor 5V1-like [Pyxicephalus adspersus]|uniref:Olfactory receptor n=1 Tax=Pyxicephalus adspersus TaxID=30357 RepID=A0AAV3A8L5_PYXAD|nr:TPA: hypothetical protein GDO54_017485 [Pyxicephalus adspersus]
MEENNTTSPSEFILLGFYEWAHLQIILFSIFLVVYIMALTGNLTIFVVILSSPNLHTPMYFFLSNLSILDITLTSSIMPKLLDICLTENHSITYIGCFTQVVFFVICVVAEYFLLAVMAYDRYAAICCPLRYSTLMKMETCLQLALSSWGLGVLESVVLAGVISRHPFTKSKKINHLYCDMKALLKLSNSSTQYAELTILVSGVIFGFLPLFFILVTYVFVIYSILKIRTKEGKSKAFSTCSSHLTVITLFFGIVLSMYMRPKSAYSIEQDKILSVLYTSLIPTLNPIIYSLRNKDVHVAIKKLRLKFSRT